MERWAWIEVNVHAMNKLGHTRKCYYVPERVITSIPCYGEQLRVKLASIEGDDEPVIVDELKRDQKSLGKAFRFLATGYLAPLDASIVPSAALDSLITLYNLSIDLDIGDLEDAVLVCIDDMDYDALPLDVFMEFARCYYADHGEDSHLTDIGELIKSKLSYLLPRLEQSMTVDQLSCEGGMLGMQLMTVLLEERARDRAMAQAKAIVRAQECQDNERACSEEPVVRIKGEFQEFSLRELFRESW
jgi:hypothetical protein